VIIKEDICYLIDSLFSPNPDKQSRNSLIVMKSRNFVTTATITTALILATNAAISLTPDNAFAYKKSQAASLANACGNDEISTNIGCQNTDSQIQGDENGAALTSQQTFPEVEPVQLPDLTVDLPVRTGVVCPTGQGSCIHNVQLEVTNLSDIPINTPFQVDVSTDNGLFHTEIIPSIAGGVTLPLNVDLGPGDNCFNPDCEVTAFVDSSNTITESDENNNVDVRLDIG
ncbi:MAG TPA: CARDB domain-containing protein, partial [Nitrososphaeraceae archaeon]|nr:CARDB domain-containing protein [Nitrososphaeraceae archaeon]